jgi:hypothetical protein
MNCLLLSPAYVKRLWKLGASGITAKLRVNSEIRRRGRISLLRCVNGLKDVMSETNDDEARFIHFTLYRQLCKICYSAAVTELLISFPECGKEVVGLSYFQNHRSSVCVVRFGE